MTSKGSQSRQGQSLLAINPNDLSPEEFHRRFVITRTPVILTQWPVDFPSDFGWHTITSQCANELIQVESKQPKDNAFGSGEKRHQMTVEAFDKLLPLGNHYLTTQYASADEGESDPIKEYCQAPLTPLVHTFPPRPKILGNLIPQQVNVWVGYQKGPPTSSGLHHDFHDNLYLLISGRKRFTLFSPKDARSMYTFGKIEKVWPNGFISYDPHVRADGAYLGHVASWALEQAEAELEKCETEGRSTKKAEARVEKAMAELLKYQPADDEEEEEENHELGSKRKRSDKDEPTEPNSFSRIDISSLHSSTPGSTSFPLLERATRFTIELTKGQALYLPASWFHEVTSSSDQEEGLHMAFNYWMCPPTESSFSRPYADDYWLQIWNSLKIDK